MAAERGKTKAQETSSLTPEQLVASAKAELKRFFGKDVDVPPPPSELLQTLESFNGANIRGFEPHYLPQYPLQEGDNLPGWKVKPEHWFWPQIQNGNLPPDSASLKEGWYLVDRRGKPNYRNGQQMYEDDYLALLIWELRQTGEIKKHHYVSDNSRFGASPDEIEGIILPEFTLVTKAQGLVRNKRYIEFNVFGNMVHPEWGETNTWEWFTDRLVNNDRCLCGGGSGSGGLAGVSPDWSAYHAGNIGFGPLVEFPPKPR